MSVLAQMPFHLYSNRRCAHEVIWTAVVGSEVRKGSSQILNEEPGCESFPGWSPSNQQLIT